MTDEATSRPARARKPERGLPHEAAPDSLAADHLIELTANEKQTKALAVQIPKQTDRRSMWKALQQLKAVLPYLSGLLPLLDARLLPLLELVGVGHAQNASLSKEVREQLAALQSGRQETRLALQDQALEIKQLEDQIARLREASEKSQLEQVKLADSVKSLRSLLRTAGAGLAILTAILIVMVAVLLGRSGR
jgi:chromosome segregation ATPase